MKLHEAAQGVIEQTEHLKEVPEQATAAIEAAARQSASQVRLAAARAHHSISVRVVMRHDGVRVTVQGQQAVRYRSMIEKDLAERLPGVRTEIRTMVSGKSR